MPGGSWRNGESARRCRPGGRETTSERKRAWPGRARARPSLNTGVDATRCRLGSDPRTWRGSGRRPSVGTTRADHDRGRKSAGKAEEEAGSAEPMAGTAGFEVGCDSNQTARSLLNSRCGAARDSTGQRRPRGIR